MNFYFKPIKIICFRKNFRPVILYYSETEGSINYYKNKKGIDHYLGDKFIETKLGIEYEVL